MSIGQTPKTFDQFVARAGQLPACPIVFTRLTEALANPDSPSIDLGEIVSTDQVLTAQILRVANSAHYGMTRRIRSVDEAIMRLGYSEIWSIASALKAQELFQQKGWTPLSAYLWEHSMKCALLVRRLGQQLNPRFADVFFTTGVLHDMGKVMMAQADRDYVNVCLNGQLWGRQMIAREKEVYGITHPELGAELLRRWNVPDTLVKLTATHDEIPADDDPLRSVRLAMLLSNQISHLLMRKDDGQVGFRRPPTDSLLQGARMGLKDCLAIGQECLQQFDALKNT